ncbi:MAG: hypothetical protein QNJ97_18000 [Myxococcota bacterium]|nr:hypothetical protein [Myxococcota bacterium]
MKQIQDKFFLVNWNQDYLYPTAYDTKAEVLRAFGERALADGNFRTQDWIIGKVAVDKLKIVAQEVTTEVG